MRPWLIAVALVGLGCRDVPSVAPDAGLDAAPDAGETALGDIADELRAIPGMVLVEERATMLPGYRHFVLGYEQPIDHAEPQGARFVQRLALLHRGYDLPVVAHNSGYFLSTRGTRSEITQLIDGNQLSMEHRYFAPSRPDPADWSKLTIEQAATDQHRITQALKARIYRQGRWLTTGASKGGMTSLFHRRFFPDDVDATVAYVAPIDYPEDAVQSPTNRYIVFLENVGTDASCRQRLKDFQNLALARRDAMKARMRPLAAYTILGEDRALEFAVEETPFIFWQYGAQARCAQIPEAGASDDTLFEFLDQTVSVAAYGDEDLTAFLPYYHQSATQLGYPASDERHLVGLVHPGENTARAYLPPAIPVGPSDDGAAMHDIQDWIAASGSELLLIYGEYDPWTAGAVDLGAATDSYKLVVPAGNHGSSIDRLGAGDRENAVALVMGWAGYALGTKQGRSPVERTLEQEELEARHRR